MIRKLCQSIYAKTGVLLPEKTVRLLFVLFALFLVLLGSFIYRAIVLGGPTSSMEYEEIDPTMMGER